MKLIVGYWQCQFLYFFYYTGPNLAQFLFLYTGLDMTLALSPAQIKINEAWIGDVKPTLR